MDTNNNSTDITPAQQRFIIEAYEAAYNYCTRDSMFDTIAEVFEDEYGFAPTHNEIATAIGAARSRTNRTRTRG